MVLLALKVLFTEFIAEMGDKTQLMLVALTHKYKLRDIILGTAVAILVLNGLAVLAGGLVGSLIPDWIIKLIAAMAFMYFAITTLKPDDGEEEEAKSNKIGFAPLAVFCTFFIAELGDKTQLTAITFGANEIAANPGESKLVVGIIVWLACSIGLFAADILGMLIGYLLKSKAPEGILKILAFVIFAAFGVYTMYQAISLLFTERLNMESSPLIWILSIGIGLVFAAACLIVFLIGRKKAKAQKAAQPEIVEETENN